MIEELPLVGGRVAVTPALTADADHHHAGYGLLDGHPPPGRQVEEGGRHRLGRYLEAVDEQVHDGRGLGPELHGCRAGTRGAGPGPDGHDAAEDERERGDGGANELSSVHR